MAAMIEQTDQISLVEASTREGVETEKCVVAQHRTSIAQRDNFVNHLSDVDCNLNKIPIEWVIDIADESSGWFYGTAYHFDDTTRMVHVMVPDKHNPTFDGHVLLDYRTMHLIECVDGKTDALFNKIVRDSIIKIRWDLTWFEEDVDADPNSDPIPGRWVPSVGRYFIRIANQLLVEDEEVGGEKGFVMITADVNVKLHHCSKGRGQEDFNRLVIENQVQSTPGAVEEAKMPLVLTGTPRRGEESAGPAASSSSAVAKPNSSRRESRDYEPADGSALASTPSVNANEIAVGISRVWDMSKDLKECVSELLDEKDKEKDMLTNMARTFSKFSMEGDLDAGLQLFVQAEEITFKEDSLASLSVGRAEREAQTNAASHETWHLVQRLEKGLNKLVRATGSEEEQRRDGTATTAAEMELVKRRERKLRKDLEAREKELTLLRSALPA